MSNATPTIKRALAGDLFMKETVSLSPKEDGTPRNMTVLQVVAGDDVVRVTDFSKQHENLVEGQSIKLVYEETVQMRNEHPVTFRNLITAMQPTL